jgi:hypothetical protein
MRPNQTRSLVTMASLERISDGLNLTAKDREELLKPAEQTPTKKALGYDPTVAVIGFFLSDNLSLELGRSDTFSRIAYLMMIRWFLRTRLAGESQETPPKACL